MKPQTIYWLLTMLIVYLMFKKLLDMVVDVEFPRYVPPPSGAWKYLVDLRDALSVFTMMCILSLLVMMGRNTNYFITTVLVLYLLYDVMYFLFDWGYIFRFIPRTTHTEKIVRLFDVYLNASMNVLLGLFSFYAIVHIFYRKSRA
jgi:hypothetical protein